MSRSFAVAFVVALSTVPVLAQVPAAGTTPAVRSTDAAAAKKPEVVVYDETADGRQQIAAALAKAKKENQRVLIQWGANWCGWCKWLAATMKSDRGLAREVLYEYQVVHIDVGRFDKHKDLAKELGAEFKAIPFWTVLDADGKPITQQNTEPFEAKIDGKDGHDPQKVLAFLKQHEAKPLAAREVVAAALAVAQREHKRVFLHFGAPWCGWCHRLEDWMARPEIAALLAKDFVDVKVDNDRMAGGKEVYEAQLAAFSRQAGGIPWFAFLDENGKGLVDSCDAKGGTIGFPYQPDEVEVFAAMLRQVKQNLTDDDIATLVASLHGIRQADEAKQKAAAAAKAAGEPKK